MSNCSPWPDFYPQGIPPTEATPAEGEAFRIVKTIPPSADDFLSTYEEHPNRRIENDLIGKYYGTSFHRNLECSKKTRDRYKPLRNRYIVVGVLNNNHGVHLHTPSSFTQSHLTLWRWKDAIIHPDFPDSAEEGK